MIMDENDVLTVDNNESNDMIICNVYMMKNIERQTEIMHHATVY